MEEPQITATYIMGPHYIIHSYSYLYAGISIQVNTFQVNTLDVVSLFPIKDNEIDISLTRCANIGLICCTEGCTSFRRCCLIGILEYLKSISRARLESLYCVEAEVMTSQVLPLTRLSNHLITFPISQPSRSRCSKKRSASTMYILK